MRCGIWASSSSSIALCKWGRLRHRVGASASEERGAAGVRVRVRVWTRRWVYRCRYKCAAFIPKMRGRCMCVCKHACACVCNSPPRLSQLGLAPLHVGHHRLEPLFLDRQRHGGGAEGSLESIGVPCPPGPLLPLPLPPLVPFREREGLLDCLQPRLAPLHRLLPPRLLLRQDGLVTRLRERDGMQRSEWGGG